MFALILMFSNSVEEFSETSFFSAAIVIATIYWIVSTVLAKIFSSKSPEIEPIKIVESISSHEFSLISIFCFLSFE